MIWKVWSDYSCYCYLLVKANNFDEAIRKGREVMKDACAAQPQTSTN